MNRQPQPPRLAVKLFEWYCGSSQVEDLQGDLDELFYANLSRMPPVKAKLKYWSHVISLLFSYALKKRKRKSAHHPLSGSNSFAMLKNYFLVATRNLAKQKFFTVINVTGLAIGMSFSLLLVALFTYVYTYDNFHVNKDRIYRVISTTSEPGKDDRDYASAPVLLANGLRSEVSGIEKVVRIDRSLNADAQDPAASIKIPLNGYFVDPEFLQMFSFPMLKGNIATALQKPQSLVITEKGAKKMFGNEDPIGKIITMGRYGDCEVTGVLKDLPKNSHMSFEVLGSFSTIESKIVEQSEWREFRGRYVYMLLSEKAETNAIENYLAKVSGTIYKDPAFKASFELQALNDIVPGPELWNQIGPDWDLNGLSIFLGLTLLILLPACFNYANISIARALKRAKEIGLRKVVGGQRNQIFFQFIVETVIISLAALAGAYGIFVLIRPEFLSMLVAGDKLDLSTSLPMAAAFVAFALLVGLIAGGIPALYFSRLNPIQALKNSIPTRATRGVSFKKVMTVFQFALSLGFIMGVVVVFSQYRKALNHNFGFTQENILNVELQNVKSQLFKNEFGKLPAVQSVSMSSGVIGTYTSGSVYVESETKTDSLEVYQLFIDHNFISNHDLKLISGKNFVDQTSGVERQVIVNEEFLKLFGVDPTQALGSTFNIHGFGDVIVGGVVANFHFQPLTEPIRSFFFRYDPKEFTFANLKVASEDMHSTFTQMEASWKILEPELAFKSKFLDDEIQDIYAFYFTLIKVCGMLGTMAVSISCLGLLGMVVYTAESKTKEVGIRKVMGASTGELALLLSKGYVKLVLIAATISIPASYFIYSLMLQQIQQYPAAISVLDIVISLGILLVLGLTTILSQTLRAARANPVDSLRYE